MPPPDVPYLSSVFCKEPVDRSLCELYELYTEAAGRFYDDVYNLQAYACIYWKVLQEYRKGSESIIIIISNNTHE